MIGSLVCGAFALHPSTGQLGLTFFFTRHLPDRNSLISEVYTQLPAAIRSHQWPTDSSDEAKKNGVAVDFRSPERLSDNKTMSYGSLSHGKQGGIDEIHLFGLSRARQVRKHV